MLPILPAILRPPNQMDSRWGCAALNLPRIWPVSSPPLAGHTVRRRVMSPNRDGVLSQKIPVLAPSLFAARTKGGVLSYAYHVIHSLKV